MKKTLLASALAAVIFVPTVSAIEIYKDDKNTVAIGGWMDARIINTQGETNVMNGSSRINFAFNRDMGNDWQTFTKFEWAVNPFGTSEIVYGSDSKISYENDEFFTNRLGYVGLSHDKYGSLAIGKQWSLWYLDVVGATNLVNTWDGNASGTYTYNKGDGSVNGTGRGDNTVQYRNSIGDFGFGLQVQLKHDEATLGADGGLDGTNNGPFEGLRINADSIERIEFNQTIGGSVTYAATDKLTLAAGFNLGEFEATQRSGEEISETDSIYGLSMTWGGFEQPGFYASVNINQNEFHDTDNIGRIMPDAVGLESLFTYKFDNGLKPIFGYNYLEAGDDYEARYNDGKFKRQFILVGLHYVWDDQTMLYLEGRKDMSDFNELNDTPDEDDGVAIGIRYYL
ncbi:porin [Shewanella sp. VB17]|uniref:porin n=1 Tax=Shewanella sp. VB17 TaxID=2739432 RepID=UPI0015643E6F|nr:porin [Shewanella sp. VB17]NRD73513.1 porin [Shewanella sp. VB17]